MIKIIHVLTDTNIGGAGIWVLNYLKSFDRTKYNVSVALPENAALKKSVSELGITVHEVKGIADQSFSKDGIREFKKLFLSEKPDIIHSHASLSARIAARMCKIKIVNTRHCLEEKKAFPKSIIYSLINNYLSDIVIGVSKAGYDNLLADGTKKSKLRLVYNGVFPLKRLSCEERQKIKERLSIPKENTVIGMVARLEPVKNHKLFLDAAKIISEKRKNVSFLIVGGGTLENALKEYARAVGIDNITVFTGYQRDICEVMNIIDINTLTSDKEALSISLIEGMSINIPAVSTDSGGPSEVIENNVSGIITENHNSTKFAEAVISLIDNPPLREKMGLEGEKRAKNIFSVEKMTVLLDEIYQNLYRKEHTK